jgi:hypothetical protein
MEASREPVEPEEVSARMIALRLVRLIEVNADSLSESLLQKFRSSAHTRHMLRVPEDELRDRSVEIYRNLSDWLLHKTGAEIERRYRAVGERRARQGVPLADLIWAILITKEHLWGFLEQEGFLLGPLEIYGELELFRLLGQFYDRAVCYTIEGYQQAAEKTPAAGSEIGTSRRAAQSVSV